VSGSINIPVVSKFDPTGLKQAEGALKGFGSSLAKIGAAVGAAFAVRAISNFAKEAVLAAEGVATANARIGQIAKSTALFGAETDAVTGRLIKFAEAQEMRLAVDAEVIKGVQGQLLTFKALGQSADETGGIFDRTTEAAFNMAAAGFGSAESNAIQLGKALEDPIRGLTALRRSGTTFTADQQELIKTLVESGNLLGAQELILGELESQYGGVAEATANASTKIGLAFDNIKEQAGGVLLPIFAELVEGLMPVTEAIGAELGTTLEALSPVLMDIAKMIPGLLTAFTPLIPVIGQLAVLFFQMVEKLLPVFVELFNMLLPIIVQLAPIIADALLVALDALIPVFMTLVDALMPIVEALLPVFATLITALAPIIVKVIDAFMPLLDLILPILIDLIEMLVPILVVVAEILSILLVNAVTYLTDAFANFMKFLEPFTKVFEDTFGGIKEFFFGIINGLIGMWEGFANSIINGVNFVIRALNRIQVRAPQWVTNLTGMTSFGFSIAELPNIALPRVALAEGGIVTGPMNALIGEAGPEAVIPLDKMRMGNTYNITVNAGMGAGSGAQIGREIISAIKAYERSSGPVFASA
jgi:phage-related protein